MNEFWQKLDVLVPEPKCDTRNNRIVRWYDNRQQPTDAAINAVTQQQLDDRKKDRDADNNVNASKVERLMFEIHFDMENRMRVLESRPAVTKQQYLTAIKNIFKGL